MEWMWGKGDELGSWGNSLRYTKFWFVFLREYFFYFLFSNVYICERIYIRLN